MKHKYLTLIILTSLAATAAAQAPFQLPNPGFEQWDGGYDSEPTHWNTFESCDGSYASLASSNHHYRRSGHRPGGSGNYYLTIYTKSTLGIKANGNMTTGRVHAGSMTASSSDNYNYTQRSNSNHCQPFTVTPDSMYVWVSFYAGSSSSTAQIEAIIHGDNDFKAPNDFSNTSLFKGRATAQTTRTTSSASSMSWQQLKVPFVYSGSSSANYMLINMTTNKNAGAGDKNDSLSIDDIVFIYSAWLTDITVDGTTIEGFAKGKFNYAVHVDDLTAFSADNIGCTTEVDDASVEKTAATVDDTTMLITLTVTAEDGTTQKVYNVTVTSGAPSDPLAIQNPEADIQTLVFPNPAKDYLTAACDGLLEIVDMQGRVVLSRHCCAGEQIAISHLPRGLYTAILDTNKKHKLVIH